ncbi:hypothetical protein ABEB36_015276 [Hypothenemus hampei]|uniref:Uncharacterized protein n=1 Tax=Hypothenemus hampei TaxID=57062 RepID=A0ABD1E0M3_HYPHA
MRNVGGDKLYFSDDSTEKNLMRSSREILLTMVRGLLDLSSVAVLFHSNNLEHRGQSEEVPHLVETTSAFLFECQHCQANTGNDFEENPNR